MATQINPALARLWIANSTRQYGYRNFTQLTELQEDQLRVLDYLEQGLTKNQIGNLDQIANLLNLAMKD